MRPRRRIYLDLRDKAGRHTSKDAGAVYGDWHRYSVIKDANPQIADANLIYAGQRINIPDATIPAIMTAAKVTPEALAPIPVVITMEDGAPALPSLEMFANTPTPIVGLAPAPAATATVPAITPATVPAPTGAKVSGYEFMVGGTDLQGKLETQLVLFNSEDEKRLALPIQRIDLKPSLAVSTRRRQHGGLRPA